MAGWVLAIDFGTSFTSVALNEGGRVELVEIDGVRAMPSGVWLDSSGSLIVGTSAERQARSAPERWERSPKRLLGEVAPLLLGGDNAVAVVEAVAAVLKHASEEACRRQGGQPEEVRLTYPARWGDRRRGALQAAAQIAGLGPPLVTRPPRLIPEPVAAALYFAERGALPAGALVGVYDLGGGTFDSTVLGADNDGYTVRALGGLDNVGGESFDALLYAHVGKEIARRDESVWNSLQEPPDTRWRRAGEDLYREVRRAKEDLSKYPSVTLDMAGLVGQPLQLTRDELESVLRPKIEATARELMDTIGRAGQRPTDLAAVYLAGGSSRMPLVERVVSETLGATARVLGEPKSVVAIGAARWSSQVRVEMRPEPAGRPADAEPAQIPILPTVPAAQPTEIVTPPVRPPTQPQPAYQPPTQPQPAYQRPSQQQPPYYPPPKQQSPYQPVQGPPPGYYPPTQQQPAYGTNWPAQAGYQPGPQQPPPAKRRGKGLLVGLLALAVVAVLAAVAITWVITRKDQLAAPAKVSATESDHSFKLAWKAVAGADHYSVSRDGKVVAATVKQTTYVDRPGDNAQHSYRVTAVTSGGDAGKPSPTVIGLPLSPAEQALVNRLPATVVDPSTCVSAPQHEDAVYTEAAVQCDPAQLGGSVGRAPADVFAGRDRTASLFAQDIDQYATKLNLPKKDNCNSPPAETNWAGGSPKVTHGKRFCYVNGTTNKATLQWDYDPERIWMYAVASDSSIHELLAWWDAKDLSLR